MAAILASAKVAASFVGVSKINWKIVKSFLLGDIDNFLFL